MQDTITCPSCRVKLRLPAELLPGGMTCPRCLALVPYPTVPQTSIQPTPSEPPVPDAPGSTESTGRSRCPHCGKPADPVWLFCPYCEEPLHQDRRGRSGSGVERDIKRDSAGTRIALGLLCVLGGIGTFWFFAAALADKTVEKLVVGLIAVLFLGLISTGIMFWRTRNNPSERGIGRVVLGTFTLIGICIAVGCSLMLALFVFAFVICLAGGMRF